MEVQIINLPTELNDLAVKISANKQEEVQKVLHQIFIGTDDWEKQVNSIEVKDINDKMSIELAEVSRKNLKQARLTAEKIFDAKREEVQNLKLEFDLEDKLWLKAKQVMQIKFKAIEEKAEWKANYVKRFEAEQKELRTQKRINEVSKFNEINRIEFESMSDESFESFLNGLKAKIELERKLEEEKVAKEKADAEAREQVRLENLRLKAEAEAREKEIEAERKENEKKLAEIKAKADKIEADNKAKLKAEQDAKIKLEVELRAKQEAELKAENERKQAELKAQAEAEKIAKAPIKKQLLMWVDSFDISDIHIENDKKVLIYQKFEAFKKWAKSEIESL